MTTKPGSPTALELGKFIAPSGARLRSVPDEALENALEKVWREVEPSCLGFPKPDGWRFQIHKLGDKVKLFSRNHKDWSTKYPSIVQMIQSNVKDDEVILDTEIVGFHKLGHHLAPSNLLNAHRYHTYLLDALYLGGKNLVSLPMKERVSFIKDYLHDYSDDAFCHNFTFAEYTPITSLEKLIAFYQECQRRRKEGFDGTILRRPDTIYFADAFKLKTEDTTDAVVIGAYRDERGAVQSLLLAVPSHELQLWVPIAKVTRTNIDWDTIWIACQPYIVDHRPSNLDEISDIPDIWITPRVVVEITMTELHSGKDYMVRAEYPRKCVLREDKGSEDATTLEQILQLAGLTEIMKKLNERAKRQQLNLFDEFASTTDEYAFDEDMEAEQDTLIVQILPTESLIQQANLLNKSPIQLSLFER